MKTFTAMYLAPTHVIEEWMKKPEDERKAADAKMRADWDAWMAAHARELKGTYALGKTKSVAKDGVHDIKNDMMLYSVVEAETHDDVAKLFADHPHLGIPGATIEIMDTRAM